MLIVQQVRHKPVSKEGVAVRHVGSGVLNVEQKARQLLPRLFWIGVRPFTNALLKRTEQSRGQLLRGYFGKLLGPEERGYDPRCVSFHFLDGKNVEHILHKRGADR